MTKEDMNKLIQVLLLETDYEKIVFDIGFITDAMMVLLEKADCIFMPEARHPIQKSKQQAFERLILREHLEQIWNKTDKVPVLHRKNIWRRGDSSCYDTGRDDEGYYGDTGSNLTKAGY